MAEAPDLGLPPGEPAVAAPANETRERLRRWAASLALALLLHGGIVAAVLSWRYAVTRQSAPGSDGSIIINLAPSPSGPIAQQSEPVPTPAEPSRQSEQNSSSGASPEPIKPAEEPTVEKAVENGAGPSEQPSTKGASQEPIRPAEEAAAEKAAKSGEESGEQKAAPAALPGAIAPAPAVNAEGESRGDTMTASGGGGAAATAPEGESMGGPIDTRMSIPSRSGWRWNKKAARAAGTKSNVLARLTEGSGGLEHPRNLSGTSGAISAIGAHIQDRVRAAMARAGARSALGGSTTNNLGGASGQTVERTVTNAVGATVQLNPRIAGTATRGPPATAMAAAAEARSGGAINGTGMTHIGSAPGVIGGATRQTVGGLNGTDFRPKHP